MMNATDVELMAKISAISAQAKQAIIEELLAECDQLLIQRQVLIEQLVTRSNPAQSLNTHAFLTQLMADDQTQIASLKKSKLALESQQVITKRSAKSINRYLTIKQF
ncbi:hypothetical protein HWV01_04660 [Moritella sp. 5]|uniref:hypothetical protein n=1 Tax=Moritella sp. 5 TaxID=2746231 RepID=UPI001BA6E4B6|nr:hypothetical protein [Moritella sp. 5]QUM79653.1 hypothetical protein HWV01_04660 [Moritella sp. 5]